MRSLFLKNEFDLFVVIQINQDVPTVGQPAEEEFIRKCRADGVLDQAGHRTGAHERIKAFTCQGGLERIRGHDAETRVQPCLDALGIRAA